MLYIGFLLSIFLDYVRPGSYLPILNAIKINSIVPLTVLLITIFKKGSVDNKKVFNHVNSKLILYFMFLLFLSVLTSDVTLYSYKVFKTVLGDVFWYYLIIKLITSLGKLKGLFVILVFSHVLLVFLNPELVLNPAVRTYIYGNAFLGDGNDFSLSVCIVIPMCLYLILESKNVFLKILYVALLLVLILAVVGTQSRGASVSLICVFFYLWWKGPHKIFGLLLIAGVLGVVINYAPPVYFERLNSIINYQEEGSAQGRIVAWKTAIRMMKEHPLTGVGTGHFGVKLGTEFRPPEFGNGHFPWITAHSAYFLLIGELGLPGIGFFLAILFINYFMNGSYYRQARGSPEQISLSYSRLFMMLNASLIGFAVGGAFLSVAYYPHLYVLAGIFVTSGFLFNNIQQDDPAIVEGENG